MFKTLFLERLRYAVDKYCTAGDATDDCTVLALSMLDT
jgi:hypothetical protein